MFPLTALFDVGMKVLDKFIPDPEAKAKAQKELLEMQVRYINSAMGYTGKWMPVNTVQETNNEVT